MKTSASAFFYLYAKGKLTKVLFATEAIKYLVGARGCQAQAITDAINQIFGFKRNPLIEHNQLWMSNAMAGDSSGGTNTQGESSPANPDPNDNQPRYEKSEKHGKQQRGNAAPAPTNGQSTLDRSVQVKSTSPRRVGTDPSTGEIVVFDQTTQGVFHGHTRSWDGLTRQMKNALIKSGQTNKRGKIQ